MANNIAFTSGPVQNGQVYRRASIEGSAAGNKLDTAGDTTTYLDSDGWSQHDYTFNVASIGTNVVVALMGKLSPNGAAVELVVSSAITANGAGKISYTGYAYQTALKLKSISAGTPEINTITAVASKPF
ncbi:MAG: hypothetical protein OHK0017_07830 [Patescibacteria group bacterium]